MMTTKPSTRRQWLAESVRWGLLGTALSVLGWIFVDVWLAAGRFSTAHWTPVAPADTLLGQGLIPLPEKRVALLQKDRRVAALSLECTHLGCLLNTMDHGFFCPCHGSEFGPEGQVYSGPATEPLPWHAVRIERGHIWVHTGQKLSHPHWVEAKTGADRSPKGKA